MTKIVSVLANVFIHIWYLANSKKWRLVQSANTKRCCLPLNKPWTTLSRHSRFQTPPLASGLLPCKVQAVYHHVLHPHYAGSSLARQPGTRNQCEPASIRTSLQRLLLPISHSTLCKRAFSFTAPSLDRLSHFPSLQFGTNWPLCVDQP